HDEASLAGAVGVGSAGGVLGEVERMAALAVRAGVDGVVCSAHEARAVVSALPGHPLIVVPGVRLGGDASGDQKRVADPRSASRAGATHVVVGRSITRSEDPQKALLAVRAELEK
ncbi:MAG: orotidine 5'-phosphate decarboxylase, partial [Gemmatimonadetes bacterium]|nr:orotidine 5'-phosphate decarboxylase [Gemmatimonadota bacterium]